MSRKTISLARWCACVLLLLGWGLPLLHAQVVGRIRKIEIQHVGPPACSDSVVRANIRVKEGDNYVQNSVDDDVRNLYGTGYFYNIQVEDRPEDDGIRLIYKLQGKPTLTQILFKGNKTFSNRKLQKKLTCKVGEPLDELKLHNDKQEILKLYQKSGRQKTKVDYVPVIDARLGRGTVTFEITEAPKVKIDDVEFVGAQAFKQSKLRRAIKTRRHWWLSWLTGSGVLKDEQFEEDKGRLTDYYRDHGYIDFEIKDIQFEQKKPKWMVIKFLVSEGTQYRVGALTMEGNKLFTQKEIMARAITVDGQKYRRGLSMPPGEVFTPKGLERDREGVEDFYGSLGYIDARVVPQRVPNTEKGTIDLLYRVEEGEKSYIERIDIKGNTKTKDKVLRRELAVNPGEVFDMRRVKLSTNRLYGLNFFSKVDAQPEPTEDKERKNLVIGVEERSTGDIHVGAGFSSVDSLVGFVEVSQANFDLFKSPLFLSTGAGQKIRVRAQYGTLRQDYTLTFIEPWFLGRKLQFSTDFYYRELDYYSTIYNVRLAGAKFGLTRTLWNDFWIGGINYTIENVGIVHMASQYYGYDADSNRVLYDPVPAEIRQEEGYTMVSKIGATLAWDTRNSPLLPTKGHRTVLATEFAGGPFGGDTDFYKLELTDAHYFRGFFPGHILEVGGHMGVVANHSGDTQVHLFDRFFLGGLYTLRGYQYHDVGPRNQATTAPNGAITTAYPGSEPIGGNTYWFGWAEYSIPIIERLRFALFYDVGNVYPDSYSFRTQGPEYGFYTDDWGVGIRLNIPSIGPLRLDYAIPLTHDRFVGSSGRFQFGVGYTREF